VRVSSVLAICRFKHVMDGNGLNWLTSDVCTLTLKFSNNFIDKLLYFMILLKFYIGTLNLPVSRLSLLVSCWHWLHCKQAAAFAEVHHVAMCALSGSYAASSHKRAHISFTPNTSLKSHRLHPCNYRKLRTWNIKSKKIISVHL
jgi:hypothetical protein